MGDPIIPYGYRLLREAFDALGKQMFGDQWTGNEAEARTPEQLAQERQQEINKKRKRIDQITTVLRRTPQIFADCEIDVSNDEEEGNKFRDEIKEGIRSLAASDPTALSPEEISQIDNEIEREAALRLLHQVGEARAAADATGWSIRRTPGTRRAA